jgi:hypothetical protein
MSLTNVSDFKKFFSMIPKDYLENTWFFPVRQDAKEPDVRRGTDQKSPKNRLLFSDCVKRLKSGKNVGLYGLPQGLMILDLDVKEGKLLASNGFLDRLESTLEIRSRNGGRQYYYLNDGKYANQILKEKETVIGELRCFWWYVVVCGSYVPIDEHNFDGDGTYRIIAGDMIVAFPGIPGMNLKLQGETKEPTIKNKIYDHERPENVITNEQHAAMMAGRRRVKK